MVYSDDRAIELLEQLGGKKFSSEQEAILRHRGGTKIVACAGSGKTTTLTNVVTKRIMTGEISDPSKLLMTTYSKSGADEMSERINKLLQAVGSQSRVEVKTMHASYYKCLAKFGMMKNLVSNAQRKQFIRQAVREAKLRLEDKDIEDLDGILSYQINNMLDDKSLYESAAFTVDMRLEDYSNIRSGYARKKQESNMMDFDDMQYYMYYILCVVKDPSFIKYCKSLWKYFYVDEFQDTSKIQFAILKALVDKSENLMVIGDDDQCIYAWRGADPSIILNIGAYYDLKKFYLSTNYRCREEILNFAKQGVSHMYSREDKDMKPFKDKGKVEFMGCDCKDLYTMSAKTTDYIISEINNGVSPDDIAVLVRNNVHAAVLSNMLMQRGYYVKSNAEMKFSNMPLFKDLTNMIEMLGDDTSDQCYDKNVAMNMLWKMVPYLGTNGASIVYEIMDNGNIGLNDALAYIMKEFFGIGNCNIKLKLSKTVEFKLRSRVQRLASDSRVGLSSLYETLKKQNKVDKLRILIALYRAGMDFTLKDLDNARVFNCFFKYINEILNSGGIEKLTQILNMTKQYESDQVAIMGEKITLSTVHSSKGMEWSHVIIMAYDNIGFPSFKYINELNERDGVTADDIREYIDGERRLNYVALTRAVDKLTLVGDFNNLSIFGLEALGVDIGSDNISKVIRTASDYIKYGRCDNRVDKDWIAQRFEIK